MQNKKIYLFAILTLILSCVVVAGSVLAVANSDAVNRNRAQNQDNQNQNVQAMPKMSGITGKIASINDTTITLESEDSYTITVNAANATAKKLISATSTSAANSTDISVSDLKVGDLITVKGNISVDASEITAGTVKPTSATGMLNNGAENQTQNNGMWSKVKNFFGNFLKK